MIIAGMVLVCSSTVATAAEPMMKGSSDSAMSMGSMKSMDTNGDGMISRNEWTKHHDMMWNKMQKTPGGMVDMKSMETMHDDKMKSGAMGSERSKTDGMTPGAPMTDGTMPKEKPKSGY